MGILSAVKTKRSGSSSSNLSKTYSLSSSDSLTATMSTTSNSTIGSRPSSRHYDTGFPDSFASFTTSRRHPDAIIDPGFAISAEHIDPARTFHRSRTSLLRKHRRTISHGKITEEGLLSQTDLATDNALASALASASSVMLRFSPDRVDEQELSGASLSAAGTAEAPVPPTEDGLLDLNGEERRRNKVFRKFINNN